MPEKKVGKKVDLDSFDLEKEREKITTLPGLIEYAHHVGSALIRPEDKGRIKGNALTAMHDQTDRQFRQIYEQMEVLMKQAASLKDRVEVSERIYKCSMSFKPVFHQVYYLYQHPDGRDVLSMVSPSEWGKKMPYKKFLASVRLMTDHTWEVLEG